jgi:lipid-binding SYLF domain-containing protein
MECENTRSILSSPGSIPGRSRGQAGRSRAAGTEPRGLDAPIKSGHDKQGGARTNLRRLLKAIAILVLGAALAHPATAQEEEQFLVERAKETVERIRIDPDYKKINELLLRSHGALIIPELVKAGFILGGEGGTGVLLRRDAETGRWGYPAFYDFGAGSIGLQIGVSASEVIFLFMTKEGLELAMSDKMKFGADAGVAVANLGGGAEASTTTNLDADIYAFSRSQGAYAGISFEGAVIVPDQDRHQRYYGTRYTARQILFDEVARNAGADGLRDALVKPIEAP